MKRIRTYIAAFLLLAFGSFVVLPVATVGAQALDEVCGETGSDSSVCANKNDSSDDLINALVNTLLFIIAALSVIMIIVGGVQYTTSQGDSGSVSKAKNTILYSVIGLVVAFIAFAIVNWVVKLF